jgi:hypothetical protein
MMSRGVISRREIRTDHGQSLEFIKASAYEALGQEI